jgi:hypothetical protein
MMQDAQPSGVAHGGAMKIEYTGRGLTVDTKVQEIVDKKI